MGLQALFVTIVFMLSTLRNPRPLRALAAAGLRILTVEILWLFLAELARALCDEHFPQELTNYLTTGLFFGLAIPFFFGRLERRFEAHCE